ncbi:MAG: NADH-quinone oxidoreductase subunit L [Deltaproteobacteria bacterium]|nr:MAG: NADH-quinone oxidoreductase subunit L [Deltaproteobacteria bacterium]
MLDLIWLVPFFPLLGVIINGLLGIRFSKKTIGLIGCLTVFGSFAVSCGAFWEFIKLPVAERLKEVILWQWIPCGDLTVNLGFLIDPLSMVMLLTVSGVSFLIHVYSVGYMHEDEGFRRYFVELNLFVFFMLTLVSANSFLLMFVGWEGVGLCSYLLIGFWYQRQAPADAGKKAFIVNRIGDYGFLLGMMLIFVTFGSLDFMKVFPAAKETLTYGGILATMITLLLFVGATGKSAQIPLYVWLPDAMEGPTPVSALIHAATMVTAGVYMVARCNALYVLAPISLWVVGIVGVGTAFYAATIGLTQFDIKRVLAYSTISQLGYMFLACGAGAFAAGIFHLMTHAFFKALLFLGAGSVMHALSGELDMRKMGGLRKQLPWTHLTFVIATLAIAGIAPLSGFFSKDAILWGAFQKHFILWLVGAITAFLTALYMFRAVFMTFYGEPRLDEEVAKHVHESPPVMVIPLVILAILSIIGGWVGIPHALGGGEWFGNFLAPVFSSGTHTAPHHAVFNFSLVKAAFAQEAHAHGGHEELVLEWSLMAISLGVAIAGILLAFLFYIKNPQAPVRVAEKIKGIYQIVFNKYYVDEIYNALFVQPIKKGSEWLWHSFDDMVVDGMVNGSGRLFSGLSSILKRLQTGYVQNYAIWMLVGIVFLIVYYLFR